jgi:tetratricopeptide (TPR) repeat protein
MEDNLKFGQALALFSLFTLSTSCSWYKDLERSLVEGDEAEQKKNQTVPRAQYDALLLKYEEIAKKYEEIKEGKSTEDKPSPTSKEMVSDLETIDVFQEAEKTSSVSALIPQDLNSQLALFRKASGLKNSSQGNATKIFQQLESQGHTRIKVHAKYELGEILFNKGQFDLSLQIFEDIITNYANSGVVLMALEKAYMCADKLGAQEKKDQYGSMLNDVFEAI